MLSPVIVVWLPEIVVHVPVLLFFWYSNVYPTAVVFIVILAVCVLLSHVVFPTWLMAPFSITVTLHVAVFPPSCVVTVIFALPVATAVTVAVTFPSATANVPPLTVTTPVLLLSHSTFLSLSLGGSIVAVIVAVLFSASPIISTTVSSKLTLSTGVTVMSPPPDVFVLFPPVVFPVVFVLPPAPSSSSPTYISTVYSFFLYLHFTVMEFVSSE